ncbi:MAG: hypothetical protein CFE45_39775 [Burkholderiales bacterium PBB5]|nr:MAG: hypothetical protein CFE45_39775 [Burkholderiales bacterium PBB5]
MSYTFVGLWEIQPVDLHDRAPGVQVVDVREPAEFNDALGHIAGAQLLPLSTLTTALDRLDRQRPVVAVCRSGARSAQAAVLLQKAGFTEVANLAGGMLRWRAQGLPVDGAHA